MLSGNHQCPLLAQSRHAQCAKKCPLLGGKVDIDQPVLTNLDL
jgi:hypothetical protein